MNYPFNRNDSIPNQTFTQWQQSKAISYKSLESAQLKATSAHSQIQREPIFTEWIWWSHPFTQLRLHSVFPFSGMFLAGFPLQCSTGQAAVLTGYHLCGFRVSKSRNPFTAAASNNPRSLERLLSAEGLKLIEGTLSWLIPPPAAGYWHVWRLLT